MRLSFLAAIVIAAGLLTGCATSAPVSLTVANDAGEPLRCTILFGHWIEQDAGTVASGDRLLVAMRRQDEDGALYVERGDGRRMMVENLVCGPLDDWWERHDDIALLPLRASPAHSFDARCGLQDGGASCSLPSAVPLGM
jgi:hypothetical protein